MMVCKDILRFSLKRKKIPIYDNLRSSGFDYAYGWNAYYERILGFCAKNSEGSIVQNRAWAWSILMIVSIWLPPVASLPFLWDNLNSSIECLSTNMPITVSIAKLIILQYNRKVTGSILVTMMEDWSKVETKKARKIMIDVAKIGRCISILSVTLTNMMFVAFIASRIWMPEEIDPTLDPRLASNFIVSSYFPFDTTNPIIFMSLWFCQFIGIFMSMISYAASDCFLSMLILHLCGQLKIVRYSLRHIANEETIHDPEKYHHEISEIVERHEQLNRLAFIIKDTFSPVLLIQMLACSVTFCFQCYAMINNVIDRDGGPFPVLYLTFSLIWAFYTLIHLFVYCYVGDSLLVESTSLGDDFYKTAWYDLSPNQAKDFLFVSRRSKTPLEIKAGQFCAFNFELFIKIMKTSMGYLSMLMAMKDRMKY